MGRNARKSINMLNDNYNNYENCGSYGNYTNYISNHQESNESTQKREDMNANCAVINFELDSESMKKARRQDENNNDLKVDCLVPGNDLCANYDVPDLYQSYRFGECIPRVGKVFSYTFWRTQANSDDVFWSIQGNNKMDGSIGGIWIATQYFGNPSAASKFRQKFTFTHPTEQNIQMTYSSTLTEGENCVFISKAIVHHFRTEDNSIDFDFCIVRSKKSHRKRKKNL